LCWYQNVCRCLINLLSKICYFFCNGCRLSRIIPGLFYITAKRVCFVKSLGVPSKKWSSLFLIFDKIQQIKLAGSDSLVFVPIQGQSIRVSRIQNHDAALAILNQQVLSSLSYTIRHNKYLTFTARFLNFSQRCDLLVWLSQQPYKLLYCMYQQKERYDALLLCILLTGSKFRN
jgi:hypothetical protein